MAKKQIKTAALPFWIGVLLASFFMCIFLLTDRNMPITSAAQMLQAMNGGRIGALLTMLAGILLFHRAWQIRNPRALKFALVGSAVFTLLDFVGFNIYFRDSLIRPDLNLFSAALDLACAAGSFLLFTALLLWLFDYLMKSPLKPAVPGPGAQKWFSCNLRSFLLYFGIFMAVNLCLQIFFYPGIITLDSLVQIEEGLGTRPLSDRNPIAMTLVMKYIIGLGRMLFGSVTKGIAFYTFVQSVLVGLTVSFTLLYMANRGFRLGLRVGTLLYFTLHPVIACYSVTLWKDIWLSYLVLIYVIFFYEIAVNQENFFRSRAHILCLTLLILGILFAKNTGLLILLPSLPFLIYLAKSHRKQILAACLICFSVFALVHLVILPKYGILEGHAAEPYSIPLQQIARTSAYEGDSLTQEQVDTISEILPYEELPELYDRTLVDNVKLALNEEAFTSGFSRYAKCWAEIGLSHPRAYLEAFLANSCGYWFPDVIYWQIASGIDYQEPGTEPVPEPEAGFNPRHYFVHLYEQLQIVPGVSTLLGTAAYFWASFLLMLIALLKKKYRVLVPMIVTLAVWIICILSPVISEFRYAFPAVTALPLFAAFILQDGFIRTEQLGLKASRKIKKDRKSEK